MVLNASVSPLKDSFPPVSPLKQPKILPRRLWFWLPRVVLLATIMYASIMMFWSAQGIGAFTSHSDRSSAGSSTIRGERLLNATVMDISALMKVSNFPSGETTTRSLRCVGWKVTRDCRPDGPLWPEKDRNCSEKVPSGESGFCEVEDAATGERFRVMERHCNSIRSRVTFRCSDAPRFINSRVQMHNKIESIRDPNLTLPNVAQGEESPRDGIVMVVYPKLLASAYASIRVLRDILQCQLPIEIWFRPDEMKPNDGILAPLRHIAGQESNITFREIHDLKAKRFVAKIHAIYYSFFDRVLFLDADNIPVRDPTFLFDSAEFVKTRAIFWPDFWHPSSTIFGLHENSLVWELLDMPFVEMFEQETGQLVIDRRRHAAPLELVKFFAVRRPDFFASLKLVWGDKDLFRLAWLKLDVPFHMIQTPPGMAGIIVKNGLRSDFCGMTMVQHDADGDVLFLHRNHQKLLGTGNTNVQANDYPDPAIWAHLLRFRKKSSLNDYVVQPFWANLSFQEKHRCYGRRDVDHDPNFYVQDVQNLHFYWLETTLRRLAVESASFSNTTSHG